jgi:nucleotide-binding universal stress UspA family protein
VVVGFTEELMAEGTLEYILSFGSKDNVFYDFIHVMDDQHQFDVLKSKLYEKLAINRPQLTGFNIRCIHPGEMKIHESIFKYAEEVRATMVILISHHRTFMENITHASVTKKALQNPSVPLMIIHTPMSLPKH